MDKKFFYKKFSIANLRLLTSLLPDYHNSKKLCVTVKIHKYMAPRQEGKQ